MKTSLSSPDRAVVESIEREVGAANRAAAKRGLPSLSLTQDGDTLTIDGEGPLMVDIAEAVEWVGRGGSVDWWPLREYLVLCCMVADNIGMVKDFNAALMKWSVLDEPKPIHVSCAEVLLALAGEDDRFKILVDKGIVTERVKPQVQKLIEAFPVGRKTIPRKGGSYGRKSEGSAASGGEKA